MCAQTKRDLREPEATPSREGSELLLDLELDFLAAFVLPLDLQPRSRDPVRPVSVDDVADQFLESPSPEATESLPVRREVDAHDRGGNRPPDTLPLVSCQRRPHVVGRGDLGNGPLKPKLSCCRFDQPLIVSVQPYDAPFAGALVD